LIVFEMCTRDIADIFLGLNAEDLAIVHDRCILILSECSDGSIYDA
jgi:hypothetical protein